MSFSSLFTGIRNIKYKQKYKIETLYTVRKCFEHFYGLNNMFALIFISFRNHGHLLVLCQTSQLTGYLIFFGALFLLPLSFVSKGNYLMHPAPVLNLMKTGIIQMNNASASCSLSVLQRYYDGKDVNLSDALVHSMVTTRDGRLILKPN